MADATPDEIIPEDAISEFDPETQSLSDLVLTPEEYCAILAILTNYILNSDATEQNE